MGGAGAAVAREALRAPEWPEELDYLRGWFFELHRTRGVDMNGLMPLSYPMIESWARLTGRSPQPHEVEAFFAMDLAVRLPDGPEKRVVKEEA